MKSTTHSSSGEISLAKNSEQCYPPPYLVNALVWAPPKKSVAEGLSKMQVCEGFWTLF